MKTAESLHQKLLNVGEFCRTEVHPLVQKFEAEYNIDYSTIVREHLPALKKASPFYIGAFLFNYTQILNEPWKLAATFFCLLVSIYIMRDFLKAMRAMSAKAFKKILVLQEIRKTILKKSLMHLDPSFRLETSPTFPRSIYDQCGLFERGYDQASADDRISGKLGDTSFEIFELHTQKRDGERKVNGKSSVVWKTVFKGLLFRADFNKNFAGHTVVSSDRLESNLGTVGRMAQRFFGAGAAALSGLQLVELENPNFEQHFKVTSTDPTEARYLLTPTFMEHLLALREKHSSALQVAFYQSHVLVAFPLSSDFLSENFSLKDVESAIEVRLIELLEILTLIDDLKLNERIFNKGAAPDSTTATAPAQNKATSNLSTQTQAPLSPSASQQPVAKTVGAVPQTVGATPQPAKTQRRTG